MSDPFQEAPIYYSGNKPIQKRHSKLAYTLVGVGAFVLLAQLIPGQLFLPFFLAAIGFSLLQRDRKGLYFTGRGRSFTRGHAFLSLGLYFLLSTFVPGGVLVPITLIALGYILLSQRDQRAPR